jgi:hypothetical protein
MWLPVTRRPSSVVTTTPSPSRIAEFALAPLSKVTFRSRKSSSSTAATSGSRCGSTCWRLTSRLTFEPMLAKMCTNSTPVTPEPITIMW